MNGDDFSDGVRKIPNNLLLLRPVDQAGACISRHSEGEVTTGAENDLQEYVGLSINGRYDQPIPPDESTTPVDFHQSATSASLFGGFAPELCRTLHKKGATGTLLSEQSKVAHSVPTFRSPDLRDYVLTSVFVEAASGSIDSR